MLSDATIRELLRSGRLSIFPIPPDEAFQPASVDLRLGQEFITAGQYEANHVLVLSPGDCVLGTTVEEVAIPEDIVARVEGKSTWGRKFLQVHATAGYIDPGFGGHITLELTNLSRDTLILAAGEPIAQISFDALDRPAERPYGSPGLGSRYQGQVGVTGPRP